MTQPKQLSNSQWAAKKLETLKLQKLLSLGGGPIVAVMSADEISGYFMTDNAVRCKLRKKRQRFEDLKK